MLLDQKSPQNLVLNLIYAIVDIDKKYRSSSHVNL